MKQLIDRDSQNVSYGLFEEPIDQVNYKDYKLETSMGYIIPDLIKPIFCNQFLFAGIIGPEMMIGLAVVDLKYIANGFVYVYDRATHSMFEAKRITIPTNVSIDPNPNLVSALFKPFGFTISMNKGALFVKSKKIQLDATIDLSQANPLRLCTRAGYRGWVYTQKTTPLPVKGTITYADQTKQLSSPEYMALLDWTTGYMRRDTYWNWASTACCLPDGRTFGLNLSCGVNETSFTENAFWVNNVMSKVDMVQFQFDKNNLYHPWIITSNDQSIYLEFIPKADRKEHLNSILVMSKFTQLMGQFSGYVITKQGEKITIESCPGWAEDHFARW